MAEEGKFPNKGKALRHIINKMPEPPNHIVFVDNDLGNHADMVRAFGNDPTMSLVLFWATNDIDSGKAKGSCVFVVPDADWKYCLLPDKLIAIEELMRR